MYINHIDIHSHLNFPQFDEDREAIIAEMKERGMATICVGTDAKTSRECVELAEKHDHIYATIGVHPTHTEDKQEMRNEEQEGNPPSPRGFGEASKATRLREASARQARQQEEADALFDVAHYESLLGPRVVAIGECGLDYFRSSQINADEAQIGADKDKQKRLFIQQIDFASEHSLPLMIHGRPSKGTMDAYDDIAEILIANSQLLIASPGNMHFFVGDIPTARKFLDLGFTLSFDGPVTFTSDYDETIKFVPSNMIMAETDAPFAAPVPHRGKRNSPLFVPFIFDRLADIRGEDREKFRKQTIENARRGFGTL